MSKKNQPKTWKVYSRKTVFKCPWFQIVEEDIKKPNGFRGKYYIQQGREKNDFVIVIALKRNCFYMTKQWRSTLKKETIEFVAGSVEKNESYLKAAKRELLEEVRIRAKRWRYLGRVAVAPGHTLRYGRIFLAEEITKVKTKVKGEPGEDTRPVKIPLQKYKQMVSQGKINGGPTLSAYLLYLAWSKKL